MARALRKRRTEMVRGTGVGKKMKQKADKKDDKPASAAKRPMPAAHTKKSASSKKRSGK